MRPGEVGGIMGWVTEVEPWFIHDNSAFIRLMDSALAGAYTVT